VTNSDDIFTCKVVDELERSALSQKENQQFEALQYSFRRQTGPLHCRLEGIDENLSRNDASTTYGMIMSFSIGSYSIDMGLPVSFLTLTFILLVCKSIWSASQLSGEVGEKNVFYTQREGGRVEAIAGHLLKTLARSRRLPIACLRWGACMLPSNLDLRWGVARGLHEFFLIIGVN
jgi:hypothetical protein